MKRLLILITSLSLVLPEGHSQFAASDGLVYKTGYSSMMKLGRDIYGGMKPQFKEFVRAQPISIETDMMPFVKLLYFVDEGKPERGVWISAGFIDLVNHVAHAKAIDKIKRGYF